MAASTRIAGASLAAMATRAQRVGMVIFDDACEELLRVLLPNTLADSFARASLRPRQSCSGSVSGSAAVLKLAEPDVEDP